MSPAPTDSIADATDDEHELLTANYLGAILVNSRGERFADESESYKVLGSAVLGQPGRMAYQVFDSVVRARSKPGVPLSDMERIEELGHLVSAPTIAALEHELGIPAGRLERTVAQYNESVSGRRAGRLRADRPRERRRRARARRGGAVLRLPRGDRDDLDVRRPQRRARHLGHAHRRNAASTGLYAAGEVVGGFHGASYMTGTALTKALVFGFEAADTIARG